MPMPTPAKCTADRPLRPAAASRSSTRAEAKIRQKALAMPASSRSSRKSGSEVVRPIAASASALSARRRRAARCGASPAGAPPPAGRRRGSPRSWPRRSARPRLLLRPQRLDHRRQDGGVDEAADADAGGHRQKAAEVPAVRGAFVHCWRGTLGRWPALTQMAAHLVWPIHVPDRSFPRRGRARVAVRRSPQAGRPYRRQSAGQGIRAVRDRLRPVGPAAYRHLRRGRAHHHGAPGLPAPERHAGAAVLLLRRHGRAAQGARQRAEQGDAGGRISASR